MWIVLKATLAYYYMSLAELYAEAMVWMGMMF